MSACAALATRVVAPAGPLSVQRFSLALLKAPSISLILCLCCFGDACHAPSCDGSDSDSAFDGCLSTPASCQAIVRASGCATL
jgi:CDGSH-type Zn-finger protein